MNVEDRIVDAVVELAITGEIEVPQDNDFGGADIWKVGQAGVRFEAPKQGDRSGRKYLAEGVRIAKDDNQVRIYRFEGNGIEAGEVMINEGIATSELIQMVALNLLNQR